MAKTTKRREATKKFFKEQGLEQALAGYFAGAMVKEKVMDGYWRIQELLEQAKESAPEEMAEVAAEIAGKLDMTEAFFEQEVIDGVREKIGDIMMPAAVFIPVKEALLELLNKQEDEHLLLLVMSAMDDIIEDTANRFANIAVLITNGIPMEEAEEIADQAGNATVVPIGVQIHCCELDDEDDGNDENDCDHEGCTCGGECGGHCTCNEEDGGCTGHGQCEGGCKCGNNADK